MCHGASSSLYVVIVGIGGVGVAWWTWLMWWFVEYVCCGGCHGEVGATWGLCLRGGLWWSLCIVVVSLDTCIIM